MLTLHDWDSGHPPPVQQLRKTHTPFVKVTEGYYWLDSKMHLLDPAMLQNPDRFFVPLPVGWSRTVRLSECVIGFLPPPFVTQTAPESSPSLFAL